MAELKYAPVSHDHEAFLEKALKRRGFRSAYDTLAVGCALGREMLSARTHVGLTQEAVAVRMGPTKSAVSRLEAAGKHARPWNRSRSSLKRLAANSKSSLWRSGRHETSTLNAAFEWTRQKPRAAQLNVRAGKRGQRCTS